MKKYTFIILLLIVSISVFSQNLNYDISSFNVPETVYRTLDFKFNNVSDFRISEENTTSEDYFKNSLYFSTSFYQYYNTKKYQGSIGIGESIRLENSLKNNSYPTHDSKTINFSWNNYVGLNTQNRIYFDKMFILGNVYLSSTNRFSKFNNVDIHYSRTSQNDYYINPKVGLGYGRIDEIKDVRLAIYILDDIISLGLNEREITKEDINKLGELIAKIKKERYFDSRLRKIKDLKEITVFLKESGVLKDENIDFFAALNDKWDYASSRSRQKGSRISLSFETRFQPHYYVRYAMDTLQSESKNMYKYNGINLSSVYQKPLSLKWQFGASLWMSYLRMNTNITQSPSGYNQDSEQEKLYISPRVSLAYYPHTRTYVWASIGYVWDQNDFTDYLRITSDLDVEVKIGYYISPQLHFSGQIIIGENYYNDENNEIIIDDFQLYTYFGLTYSLF